MQPSRRSLLARGVLSAAAGTGALSAPASGATLVIYDSTANSLNTDGGYPPIGLLSRRLFLTIYSSHVSANDGVKFEGSVDGTNWDVTDLYTLAATTATIYNYHVRTPHVRVRFVNSANTLSAFRFALMADPADPDAGQ